MFVTLKWRSLFSSENLCMDARNLALLHGKSLNKNTFFSYKFLSIAAIILLSIVASSFIAYEGQIDRRIESELADLKYLFDGKNQFGIYYKNHYNSDIPKVISGYRSSRMSLRKEVGAITLFTEQFSLERNGSISLSKSQRENIKLFIITSVCSSKMLAAYDNKGSTITVDLKAQSETLRAQVLNLRITPARCKTS